MRKYPKFSDKLDTILAEMPLRSYHMMEPPAPFSDRARGMSDRISRPLKSGNYSNALTKFMTKFPGPDWIVIIGQPNITQRNPSGEWVSWSFKNNWREYLDEQGYTPDIIDSSIIFLHSGTDSAQMTVTPWILVHNFAHAIDLDGKSHVVYPLLGYEELSLNDEEWAGDRAGEYRQNNPDNMDPEGVWFPGTERFGPYGTSQHRNSKYIKQVVATVASDLKFKSAQAEGIDYDELVCEMFVDFVKHGGKIRSKNGIDYSGVEAYFHRVLNAQVGKLTIFYGPD